MKSRAYSGDMSGKVSAAVERSPSIALLKPIKDMSGRVLLVDDDPGLLKLLSYRLRSAGFEILAVNSGNKALEALATYRPRLVISDLRMDGMDGLALFDKIHMRHPSLPVIILTAHGTIPDAVDATTRGLFGFLTKPFDSEQLLDCVRRAITLGAVDATRGSQGEDWEQHFITSNPSMLAMLERARRAASTPTPVLIEGAKGTGRAALASAIHAAGNRRMRPFVPVDCSGTSAAALEMELFGGARQASADIARSGAGAFQAAQGGTLFLEDIGSLPLSLQVQLARTIREKTIWAVDKSSRVAVDVRIIVATDEDLETAVHEGQFRKDLFYQLNVLGLDLPPLSQRREDIALLAMHYLERVKESYATPVTGFAPQAMELLVQARWPGNLMQLQNVVEQTAAMATTPVIPKTLVQAALNADDSEFTTLTEARNRFERQYLVRLLRTTGGNVSRAARLAGRDRSKFYQLLRKHRLEPAEFRGR